MCARRLGHYMLSRPYAHSERRQQAADAHSAISLAEIADFSRLLATPHSLMLHHYTLKISTKLPAARAMKSHSISVAIFLRTFRFAHIAAGILFRSSIISILIPSSILSAFHQASAADDDAN